MRLTSRDPALQAAVITLGILLASLLPVGPVPGSAALPTDKLVHILMYTLLAGAWRRARPHINPAGLAAALICYGGLIEILQGMLPYRTGSVADALANAFGVVVAGLLWRRTDVSGETTITRTDTQ